MVVSVVSKYMQAYKQFGLRAALTKMYTVSLCACRDDEPISVLDNTALILFVQTTYSCSTERERAKHACGYLRHQRRFTPIATQQCGHRAHVPLRTTGRCRGFVLSNGALVRQSFSIHHYCCVARVFSTLEREVLS